MQVDSSLNNQHLKDQNNNFLNKKHYNPMLIRLIFPINFSGKSIHGY